MVEFWEEEGEQDSEGRDGPGDEIGSDSVMERIRNFPMYSPPRSLTDWSPDQVQSPPLDLFGLPFGSEAYVLPATTTVCNIEEAFGVHFLFERKDPLEFLMVEVRRLKVSLDEMRNCLATSHSKEKNTIETPERKYRNKRLITLDDLRQLFGRKREDAAKALGVSVPTFKRYCRQNKITFWNGDGCSLIEPMVANNSVQQNSSGSKPLEVHGEKEISTLSGARQDAVTVKARYGEEITSRFQLSSESGVLDLKEEVAVRLELEVGSFNVKYEDEDQEWVLISCDKDLQACVKFSSLLGNQVIQLLVTDKISNAEKSLKSC